MYITTQHTSSPPLPPPPTPFQPSKPLQTVIICIRLRRRPQILHHSKYLHKNMLQVEVIFMVEGGGGTVG